MSDYPELAMHIDGEWVGVGQRRVHQVRNPATGQVLGDLPLADAADLDRALEAAAKGFKLWRATPANDRARVLKKAADLMRERVEHIASIATREEGKTLGESRIETNVTANWLEFAGVARQSLKPLAAASSARSRSAASASGRSPSTWPVAGLRT